MPQLNRRDNQTTKRRRRIQTPASAVRTSSLSAKPGSSTKKQHQFLVMAGRAVGYELAELRQMVGGSLRALSVQEASNWIKRLSDRDLPFLPGQAPRPRRRKYPGITRMITAAQIEQIDHLGNSYFDLRSSDFMVWLKKNFKIDRIRDLATAERGGQVIAVLKGMYYRKGQDSDAGGITE